MDFDFARKRRRFRDDHDGGYDEDRGRRGDGSRRRRRARPHLFAWLMIGGGALLLVMALLVIALTVGLLGYVGDAYFAITKLILPESWHDSWTSLPDVAHVAMALGAVFVTAGVAGELLD
jgi:hypothetical protein